MPSITYTPGKGLIQESGSGVNLNYLDFLAGNHARLTATAVAVSDAEADAAAAGATATTIAAATVAPGAVNTCAFDGDAAGSVYLPAADPDTHLVVEITGDQDGANALSFFTRGSASEVLRGDTAVLARHVVGPVYNNLPESVLTAGTSAVPTSIKLILTNAASADNFAHTGTMFHFYCQTGGQWLVKVLNVVQGTGADGALSVA